MTWQPEADDIQRRRQWADELGGAEAIERQHKTGRLTIRERIVKLVDARSFREVGKLTGYLRLEDEGLQQVVLPVERDAKVRGPDLLRCAHLEVHRRRCAARRKQDDPDVIREQLEALREDRDLNRPRLVALGRRH